MLKVPRTSPPVPQVSMAPVRRLDRAARARASRRTKPASSLGRLAAHPHAHQHAAQLGRRDVAVEDGVHERCVPGRGAGSPRDTVASASWAMSGPGGLVHDAVGSRCPAGLAAICPTVQPGREVGPPAVPPVFGDIAVAALVGPERARGSIRRRPRAGSQHRRLSVTRCPRGCTAAWRRVLLPVITRRVQSASLRAPTDRCKRRRRSVDISRAAVYRPAI